MTTSSEILVDAIGRVKETAERAASGLTAEQLEARLDPKANTVAWLLWHIGRVQDAQVADVAGGGEVWVEEGWRERFALPFPAGATGYGHSPDDVAAVKGVAAQLYVDYIAAVCARSVEFVESLSESELDRIVDERWDPPVTLAARLVSVISDDLQHAGQAAFLRGIVQRRTR